MRFSWPLLIPTCCLLALVACAGDTSVDLSVRTYDGRPLATVEVVVCDARNRTEVLDTVTLGPQSDSTIHLSADGQAVAFAATTPDGLCAATCQMELDPDASLSGEIVLVPCLACARAEATAANVCRDPLCFVDEVSLSACR